MTKPEIKIKPKKEAILKIKGFQDFFKALLIALSILNPHKL